MFVAVYWWRVHAAKEKQFPLARRRGKDLISRRYRSYGSRLHRDADGRVVGNAEWPDEAAWRSAFGQKKVYADPTIIMNFTDDLLIRAPAASPSNLDGRLRVDWRRAGTIRLRPPPRLLDHETQSDRFAAAVIAATIGPQVSWLVFAITWPSSISCLALVIAASVTNCE